MARNKGLGDYCILAAEYETVREVILITSGLSSRVLQLIVTAINGKITKKYYKPSKRY